MKSSARHLKNTFVSPQQLLCQKRIPIMPPSLTLHITSSHTATGMVRAAASIAQPPAIPPILFLSENPMRILIFHSAQFPLHLCLFLFCFRTTGPDLSFVPFLFFFVHYA
jgi:hypothetical protein